MSDEPVAVANSAPTTGGEAWGDAIEEGRKQELWGRLRAWWDEKEHGERKGPFARERLTGAEVFWLAVCAAAQQDRTSTVEEEERLRAGAHYGPLDLLCLTGADLSGAQLQKADLSGAQLQKADLNRAQLEGADLRAAQLEGADLRQSSFDKRTNMDGARLTDVRLDGVIFDNTNLSVVDWSRVRRLQDERIAWQARFGDEVESWKRGKRKSRDERRGEYQAAARAYRLLVVALQAKGMSEEAAGYAYRAQLMQRGVYRFSGWRAVGRWLFSGFLDGLAGYGYAPGRTLLWYLVVLGGFAGAYFAATHGVLTFGLAPSQVLPLKWYEALILSVSAFHGRGFFQPIQSLGDPVAILAALEAIIGLMIEISFIATFTQRFFGAR